MWRKGQEENRKRENGLDWDDGNADGVKQKDCSELGGKNPQILTTLKSDGKEKSITQSIDESIRWVEQAGQREEGTHV